MKWPHICGRSTGWKRVAFTVIHQWKTWTGAYEREREAAERRCLDHAVQALADDIDRRAFEYAYRNIGRPLSFEARIYEGPERDPPEFLKTPQRFKVTSGDKA